MANAGPNTNGSQFFFAWKDTTLAPNYTPFGTVIGGMDVLQKIAAAGSQKPMSSRVIPDRSAPPDAPAPLPRIAAPPHPKATD
jgi:cyclophilin family peptidyl-prolyl cis-trans isomerase